MNFVLKLASWTAILVGGAFLLNNLINKAYGSASDRYVTFGDESDPVGYTAEGNCQER